MTILDRLLGRTAPEAVKASTGGSGAGVLAYYNDVPLWSASRDPRKLMRQAQELYHSHDVVHQVEQRISSTASGVGWHLEDENEEEIDRKHPLSAYLDFMEHPQANLPVQIRKLSRRSLWQVTLRHGGLCGTGFWFPDERDGLLGVPRSLLYINPARMLAQYDKAGNTVGWKLDSDDEGNGGLPITVDQVLQYEYDPPDVGAYPIGIVESAGLKVHVNKVAVRHEAGVIGSGGRLTGIFAPKETSNIVNNDWTSFVRDWRNIANDPDAALRAQIVKQPIEHIRTTATPQELQLIDVWKLSREDIYSAWGLPLSQQGITQAQGLNSGDTKGYDEAILWQGPVHARLDPLREMVQGLFDDIARKGGPKITFVLEEPEFDDETPLYERAQKAESQPLRNRERRAILGLEPFGDPMLDEAVWLPSTIIEMAMAPDMNGAMPQRTPEQAAQMAQEQAQKDAAAAALAQNLNQPPPQMPMKATLDPLKGLRRTLDGRWTPAVRKSVLSVLREQAREIARRVREKGDHIKSKPSDTSAWWSEAAAEKALRKALDPHAAGIAAQVATRTQTVLARPAKADTFADTVATAVRSSVGQRITKINQTTREAIAALIAQGFADGLSPSEIGDLIEGATTFDEARAELIARTETALVYNESALRSFTEFGVDQVQAIDGDGDPECAARDGQVFSVAEAMDIEDHPNGTLDWSPVV